jgi:hypothetical protein
LKRILTDIHRDKMIVQKGTLESKLKEWKGEFDQIDDILVIGIKI